MTGAPCCSRRVVGGRGHSRRLGIHLRYRARQRRGSLSGGRRGCFRTGGERRFSSRDGLRTGRRARRRRSRGWSSLRRAFRGWSLGALPTTKRRRRGRRLGQAQRGGVFFVWWRRLRQFRTGDIHVGRRVVRRPGLWLCRRAIRGGSRRCLHFGLVRFAGQAVSYLKLGLMRSAFRCGVRFGLGTCLPLFRLGE